MPDGSVVHVSTEPSIQDRLDLLDVWYEGKIAPFTIQRACARYEIQTGHEYAGPKIMEIMEVL